MIEPILGGLGTEAPRLIFPAWPGSYPQRGVRRCFHITPFGPKWAEATTSIAADACSATKPPATYIRGDKVLDADIIRSIWDNICRASHVVVDLTGFNPNVLLELGIAHALGSNVLLITQDETPEQAFPSIAKMRIHRYSLSGEGLADLRNLLDRFLDRLPRGN